MQKVLVSVSLPEGNTLSLQEYHDGNTYVFFSSSEQPDLATLAVIRDSDIPMVTRVLHIIAGTLPDDYKCINAECKNRVQNRLQICTSCFDNWKQEEPVDQPEPTDDPIGTCPICNKPVYPEADGPVWTCPYNLSEDNPYHKKHARPYTTRQMDRIGVYSQCGDEMGDHCNLDDHLPMHSECYNNL